MKIVLGGGIGGLAAGYYLRQKFPTDVIKILESTSETGGWIKSKKLNNGAIFEQGPRTLRPKGEAGYNTLKLVDDLGLSDKIKSIPSSHPAAKNRMIYANGELHTLPSNLTEVFHTLTPFSKPLIFFALNDLFAKKKKVSDESIYSFASRRFGQEIADYAISPLVCGICAGDAKQISVKFLMKSIFEKEQKYGGILKGYVYDTLINGFPKSFESSTPLIELAKREKWNVYSFTEGMETLPTTLKENLLASDVGIQLNDTCDKLEFKYDSAYISTSGTFLKEPVEHVISSIPAKQLASLIQSDHPVLASNLKKIPTVDVAVVNLLYKNPLPIEEAFGFLVPPSEKLPILGVTFDTCCFPVRNTTILTVMMGGHWFKPLFGDNPSRDYLLETAIQQVKKILKMYATPQEYKVNILRDCIPQYIVGHSDVIKNIEGYISSHKLPLSICGSSYYGAGVNDVILSARNAVDNM